MNIIYDDITLRAIEREDLDILREMMNDPEIEKMLGGHSCPVSQCEHMRWFENLGKTNELRLMIDVKNHGAVGTVILSDIDKINRTAQYHIKMISDKNIRGKGFGTGATKALVNYAFKQLNLNLIYAYILDYNEISQKMFIKSGFKKDGVLRNRVYKDGAYHSYIAMSIEKGDLGD